MTGPTPDAKPHVLLFGCGGMGGAHVEAWKNTGNVGRVTALTRSHRPVYDTMFTGQNRVFYTADAVEALPEGDKNFDVLLIAVKPKEIKDGALQKLKPFIRPETLVISMAAGIRIDLIARELGLDEKHPVIRAMPNTPCKIGQGVAGLYADEHVSPADRLVAESLYSPTDMIYWVDRQDQMSEVTALSGSGPGIVAKYLEEQQRLQSLTRVQALDNLAAALQADRQSHSPGLENDIAFIDAFEVSATDMGFDPELSRSIVYHTVNGTIELARHKESQSFEDIYLEVAGGRAAVGTTMAGLKMWDENASDAVAVKTPKTFLAARDRAIELA